MTSIQAMQHRFCESPEHPVADSGKAFVAQSNHYRDLHQCPQCGKFACETCANWVTTKFGKEFKVYYLCPFCFPSESIISSCLTTPPPS